MTRRKPGGPVAIIVLLALTAPALWHVHPLVALGAVVGAAACTIKP